MWLWHLLNRTLAADALVLHVRGLGHFNIMVVLLARRDRERERKGVGAKAERKIKGGKWSIETRTARWKGKVYSNRRIAVVKHEDQWVEVEHKKAQRERLRVIYNSVQINVGRFCNCSALKFEYDDVTHFIYSNAKALSLSLEHTTHTRTRFNLKIIFPEMNPIYKFLSRRFFSFLGMLIPAVCWH